MVNQSRIVTSEQNIIYIDKQIENIMIYSQDKQGGVNLGSAKAN